MIYGERIRLRGVEKKDLLLFVEWLNDPEVIAGLSIFLPLTEWEEEEWFVNLAKLPAAEKPLAIEIPDGDGWRLIGNFSLLQLDTVARLAEAGIFIGDKSVWNQGYGTEAMRLLLKHGFETLNLNRIWLRVYEGNRWAIRSYEKAGFIHEGRQRQAYYKQGKYQDILIMSVLRSEWDALNKKRKV